MIAPWIEKYIGVPFEERGRDFEGVDCYGLLMLVYKNEYGISLDECNREYRISQRHFCSSLIEVGSSAEVWEPIQKDNVQAGDVVIINIYGLPMHLGICVGEGLFLHSIKGADSCLEKLDSPSWEKRVNKFYRYKR